MEWVTCHAHVWREHSFVQAAVGGACVVICSDLGMLVSKRVERGVRWWEPSERMDGAMLRLGLQTIFQLIPQVSMTRWTNS